MKIAFLHPFQLRYRRGIERFVWELTKNLATHNDIEIDILTWNQLNPIDWGELPTNISIYSVPYSRFYARYLAIPYYVYWLLRNKYDLVFLSFAGYGEAESIALVRKIYPQHYAIIFHYPFNQLPHRYKEFEKFLLAKEASALISVSQYVADGVKTKFGVNSTIISNGVNPDTFKPSEKERKKIRKELGLSEDAPVLITTAALEMRKGIQYIIQLLPYLTDIYPNLKYLVLGEGPDRFFLEQEVKQKGLNAHVQFLGQKANIPAYLAAADIGCLLSTGEAFGISILEYMAMQLPVITSKHPPFPELINPSWGIMVDEQHSQEAANVIKELLSDSIRRHKMGVAGRQEVIKHYTWASVAEKYLLLLKQNSL